MLCSLFLCKYRLYHSAKPQPLSFRNASIRHLTAVLFGRNSCCGSRMISEISSSRSWHIDLKPSWRVKVIPHIDVNHCTQVPRPCLNSRCLLHILNNALQCVTGRSSLTEAKLEVVETTRCTRCTLNLYNKNFSKGFTDSIQHQ